MHYCKREGHWKIECPNLKEKKEANISNATTVVEGDDIFSL